MRFFLTSLMAGLSVLLSTGVTAQARPISYPNGWSAMIMNDGDSNSVNLQYSPTARYSVGVTAEHGRADDTALYALQFNTLVKRWNNTDSQGNVYTESGVGVMDRDSHLTPAGFTGITADWEDRRFLVSYRNRLVLGEDVDENFIQWGRVGVAPYVGDYGDLHTWTMVEIRHSPENKDSVTVTPFVRLFKGTTMVETGVSLKGDVTFNMMQQF